MELKHLEMVSALNDRLGVNGQLLNLNKECVEMQVVISDLELASSEPVVQE